MDTYVPGCCSPLVEGLENGRGGWENQEGAERTGEGGAGPWGCAVKMGSPLTAPAGKHNACRGPCQISKSKADSKCMRSEVFIGNSSAPMGSMGEKQ